MTQFVNKDFRYDGLFLTYGKDRRFVARFKNGGMVAFKKFLRENFTVEEYFDLLAKDARLASWLSVGAQIDVFSEGKLYRVR